MATSDDCLPTRYFAIEYVAWPYLWGVWDPAVKGVVGSDRWDVVLVHALAQAAKSPGEGSR